MSTRQAGIIRSIRVVRATRTIRIFRLMRLAKLKRLLFTIEMLIDSEWVTLFFAVLRNLFTIMILTHFVACLWFYVGTRDPDGWVARGTDLFDYGSQYLICMHWAMAQFTPGASPVQPVNDTERVVAIMILGLGFVMSTCFVSSITSCMASIWTTNRTGTQQHIMLKNYLNQNSISWSLTSRITRHIEYIQQIRRKQVHVSKVGFLHYLSKPLSQELTAEIHTPTLKTYGFFIRYSQMAPAAMRELCSSALSTHQFAHGDRIFNRGCEAQDMLFISGAGSIVIYHTQKAKSDKGVRLAQGDCLVEVVLWAPWKHAGDLVAFLEVELTLLNATKFHTITCSHAHVYQLGRLYAIKFMERFQNGERITDLHYEEDDPTGLLREPSLSWQSFMEKEHSSRSRVFFIQFMIVTRKTFN